MAVKLRLTRMGKKKQPFYRIVATDSRTRRDGKYIEKIGYYNPLTNPAEIFVDEEKAFYWLKNGAIPSDTVKNLFSQKGIMLKWHHIKQGADEAKVDEEYKKWEVLQLERQKKEEALAAQAKRDQEEISDEIAEPEAREESDPGDKKEVIEPEVKEEQVAGEEEEVPAENTEQAVEPQPEDQSPQPAKEEAEPLAEQPPEQGKEESDPPAEQPPAEAAAVEKAGEGK